jgi:hypothetical protein
MDPDTCLAEMRAIAARMLLAYDSEDGNGIDQDDADMLAQRVQDMDEWLSNGGFLPQAWDR